MGNAFIMPVTATVWVAAPAEVKVTLPAILPGGSVAAERTYMIPLSTFPPDCIKVMALPKPLPVARDISNPTGAVAIILPVKPLPETLICWTSGLAEAEPTQAEITPLAVLAVMVGGGGLTVMVKVIGVPGQPVPVVIKLPYAAEAKPVFTVVVMVFVEVLITETLFEP